MAERDHITRPAGTKAGEQATTDRGSNQPPFVARRYSFKLYPSARQEAVLHDHRRMIADLWNALLQRYEDIQRRTVQRQVWYERPRPAGSEAGGVVHAHDDTETEAVVRERGKRHSGVSIHSLTWVSERKASGEVVVMTPSEKSPDWPKPYSAYDMQNEITHLFNELPEWRELSVWCGHRTAGLLDRAIQAFYRRAKAGGGKAGYPKPKRRNRHDSIPHRFLSGCKLRKDVVLRPDVRRGPDGRTMVHTGLSVVRETWWDLTVKGVPGAIRARGTFPRPAGSEAGAVDPDGYDAIITKWTDADIVWRANEWWISVAVEMRPRREGAGRERTTVDFSDLIDAFARVNGVPVSLPELEQAIVLEERLDKIKSIRDRRWPRGKRVPDDERQELEDMKAEIAGFAARIARKRRNALHVWTNGVVERASDLTIVAPPVSELTRSPHGDEISWGANTEIVSDINRNTLSHAPALAIQMLQYKAAEALIRCDVVEAEASAIAVGAELVAAGKVLRRARRERKRARAAE